jgi:dehydrogenase/reductase SDR family protein 12
MPIRHLIDTLLELTVIGSFSSIGFTVRDRLFRWQAPAPDALVGRTVLITGPTSGLGRVAAERFASHGARLILVGRNADKLEAVRADLSALGAADRTRIVVADMGSLASVRAAVDDLVATETTLDVIVDNAGAIFAERVIGPDGIESTWATMVVGPFVLVSGLMPLLRRSDDARVIAVTSGGQYTQSLDLDDLEGSRQPYSGPRAYARAKRAQVALVREWDRRLGRSGVTVDAMHPGWADTPGLAASLPAFSRLMGPILRTASQGIDTLIWLATAPNPGTRGGQLYLDRVARPFDRVPGTRLSASARRQLWDRVVAAAGVGDPTLSARSVDHDAPLEEEP